MKTNFILFTILFSLTACSRNQTEDQSEVQPATEVTLTHPVRGHIPQETIFTATTAYQSKTTVSAPIPSYVMETRVKPGTRVQAGQVLYCLQSKEQHALGSGEKQIEIKAERSGIVLDVQAQTGSYALEGSMLCTLADGGSLVFEVNVPYEQRTVAKAGSRCTLELPDGTRLSATIQSPLVEMNTTSQSTRVVAIADAPFLPEGMNVKAIFTSRSTSEGTPLLPKSTVQSDETLTEHWVMRLATDSTVIRVPVNIGGSTADSIEVLSPNFSPEDRVIATGGYGLEDGDKVKISH